MRFSVEGREFNLDMAPGQIRVDGKPFKVDIKKSSADATAVNVDGMPYQVEIKERRGNEVIVAVGGKTYTVVMEAPALPAAVVAPAPRPAFVAPPPSSPPLPAGAPAAPPADAKAPKAESPKEAARVVIKEEPPVCDMPFLDGVSAVMPGRILSVKVQEGQVVAMGTVLCILEAMKMENEIRAAKDGTVTNIRVKDGDIVNGGDMLMQVC